MLLQTRSTVILGEPPAELAEDAAGFTGEEPSSPAANNKIIHQQKKKMRVQLSKKPDEQNLPVLLDWFPAGAQCKAVQPLLEINIELEAWGKSCPFLAKVPLGSLS